MSLAATGRRRRWAGLVAFALLVSALPFGSGVAIAADPLHHTKAGVSTGDPPRPAVASTTATVLTVSAGDWYTCAVRSDGQIGCWGYETNGEATPPSGSFASVTTGSTHTCAIRDDGAVVCWGRNGYGESSPPDGTFKDVSAGYDHTCAIRSDGTLACWGNNDHFQASPPAGTFKDVDSGGAFTCAVRTDGTLWCRGDNTDGQATPPTTGTFLDVTAGESHACAVAADGTLTCWGYNGNGRAAAPSGTFTSVSAGGAHTCAIRTDGTLACWGDDEYGQAGPPAGTFVSVSAGADHSCAIRTDTTLVCWGDDEGGAVTPKPTASAPALPAWSTAGTVAVSWAARPAISDVTTFDLRYRRAPWNGDLGAYTTVRSAVPETTGSFDLAAGYTYCFAVRARDADNVTSDWSDDACTVAPLDDRALARSGTWTLGSGSPYYRSTYSSTSVSGAVLARTGLAASWVALVATTCPTCGIVQVFLGTSSTPLVTVSLTSPTTIESRFIPILNRDPYDLGATATLTIKVVTSGRPVTIDGLLATRQEVFPAWADANDPPLAASATSAHKVRAVSSGFGHTCAVKDDGTLACWGSNANGMALPPAGTFTAVSAGLTQTCAIRTDGSLACWGSDYTGESTPPEGIFTSVASGLYGGCAVREGGSITCWGDAEGWTPPGGSFMTVSADADGGYCALRASGALVCWGTGYDEEDDVVHPAPAGTFTALDGRCAVRTDGALVCWGYDSGQMEAPAGTFKAVSTGLLHACAIRADDRVVCFGDNEYGEAAPPAGAFTSLDAGYRHTCAVAADGTLACWGQDRSSQVTPRPVVAITGLPTWLASQKVPLSWRGTALGGMASYDLRVRRAAWNGSFGATAVWRSGLTGTSASFSASPGSTYCYALRGRDSDGLTSGWTTETCTSIPLDDRSLTRAGAWTAGTGSAYYRSTYLRSSSLGAKLTRTGVVAKRIALLATTCPTCGTVKVYWGSTLLKTISLHSDTTVTRKFLSVATFGSVRSGTLVIKVASSGKKVIVDGVAIRRN